MHMKFLLSLFIALMALLTAAPAGVAANAPFTVVIDAGHGGKDAGTVGRSLAEKTVVLDVAKRLEALVKKYHANVKVVMTRSTDVFVPLQERANIANRAKADLFISIHVNSVDEKSPGRQNLRGAQVYVLGSDRSDASLAVAMRENAVLELEADHSTRYKNFDPNSAESYIIFELSNNLHLSQSLDFARQAQQQLVATAGRADKGVRQAGFLVLRATSMPAALVELDFMCNPDNEAFLASEAGRQKCAQAIFNAFSNYYSTVKN